MASDLPRFGKLEAPAHWRAVEFISDLHLHAGDARTFEAWRGYMAGTRADAVFILGDLFEAWPGDDAILEPGFDADCAGVLKQSASERAVFFMHGNRDFMVGSALLEATGARLLEDPTALDFLGSRWLLSHGDLLCLDDVDYLRFRAEVRQSAWKEAVMARPLAERRELARKLRAESESHQRDARAYADVDAAEATRWLQAAHAAVLIHGHTHKPARHELAAGLLRIVLSDWDANAQPVRLEVLRLDDAGVQRLPLR